MPRDSLAYLASGNSPEPEEPSAEDLLIDLEHEMSKICPWTCPNRVRVILSKIAFCVHKSKDPVNRTTLLNSISESPDLLKSLLKLIEECSDSTVLGNLVAIVRELVSARTEWRPAALAIFLDLDATDVISRLLLRVCKPSTQPLQPSLSDHAFVCCFWILSALATKDSKFSLRLRQTGGIRTVFPILKHLSGKVGSLYPILQVVKALSRNSLTSTILGKDGIVPLVTSIVTKLARTQFGPRLKVAVEALGNLTKARQNQLLLTKQNFVHDLVGVFASYEKFLDRGRMAVKIIGGLLSVFQHVVGSKIGKQQFLDAEGLERLKEFCTQSIFDDKRWDRLLYRACAVLCKVCDSKPLPVDVEFSPAKFTIPEGHQAQPEVESSSESTSRETTPESDESDDDEENEDGEEEEVAAQDDDDGEDHVPEFASGASSGKTVEQRGKLELAKDYARFFPEYSTPNIVESHTNPNVRSSDVSDTEHYLTFAQQTHGLIKFAKVAYPDLVAGQSPIGQVERLLEKNKQACRHKVVNNIRQILSGSHDDAEEESATVLYDLDAIVNEDKMFGRLACDNANLTNTDEFYVNNFDPEKHTSSFLKFESRFECGNLRKAIHVGGRQYNLILTPDVNSDKHHQWFYFQVSNMRGGEHYPYFFNIINYEKANSQFNFGMQPVMFSVKEAMAGRPHWRRVGEDIAYFRNNFSKSSQINGDNYMTASLTVTFPHDGDICYLAYHYPYTYSRMKANLDTLAASRDGFYFKIDWLTESLGEHDVPLVTITAKSRLEAGRRPLNNDNIPVCDRPIVVLTGRVHPGETNSSWIMEGILDFLTGNSPDADEVRSRYVFKIIPMLNVEGVINGCHRCGLTGEDLNRRWQDPHARLHPVIFHSKGIISYIKQILSRDVFLFCDFHGHSRKKNVFLYGCSAMQSWWPPDHDFYDDPAVYKQLAEILHDLEPGFDKRSCKYTIERGRESTARVVVWREFDVSRSYTLESSFSGFNLGQLEGIHISTYHLRSVGHKFLQALLNLDSAQSSDSVHESPSAECKASVEKDHAMKITRLVISMPQA